MPTAPISVHTEFVDAFSPVLIGLQHQLRIQTIANGRATCLQRQVLPGPPFHGDDLVKVTEGPYAGRWGQVTDVIDYRHTHRVGVDNSHLMSFLVMVVLLTVRPGIKGCVEHPPGPVPFEPHEIAPLFDATGCWVRAGRVVSRPHWPVARDGYGA